MKSRKQLRNGAYKYQGEFTFVFRCFFKMFFFNIKLFFFSIFNSFNILLLEKINKYIF
jgi:hypothetical protein